jgi:hypothetical protein
MAEDFGAVAASPVGGTSVGGTSLSAAPACSDWARSQDLSPIGSAGHYQGYLLVEVPLPWPPDISEIAELTGVAQLALRAGLRLQAIAPGATAVAGTAGGAVDQPRRLIYYGPARPGRAGPLRRRERLVGPEAEALAEAAAELLAPPDSAPDGQVDGSADDQAAGQADGSGPVDVLVCTHGRRDACCGGRGTDLVRALAETTLSGARTWPSRLGRDGPAPEVRVWRTSHTGGHRFAPTALVLPSATLWAWADVALLDRVVGARGPVSEVVSRYRGCATLGPPAHQAVEKSVLAEVGWPLLSSWRLSSSLGDGWVRLATEVAGTWEGRVAEGRHVPQPECRTPPELASKQGVEWVVEELHQVAPGP